LSIELAIFELIKGGILGIFICEAFDSYHSSFDLAITLLLKTFVAVYADYLSKTEIFFNFLFFWHLKDIINCNIKLLRGMGHEYFNFYNMETNSVIMFLSIVNKY